MDFHHSDKCGCTVRATKTFNKTAPISNSNAQHCLGNTGDSVKNNNKNKTIIKISNKPYNNITLTLLSAMLLTTLMQQHTMAAAAKLPAAAFSAYDELSSAALSSKSSASSSYSSSSSAAAASQELLLELHNYGAGKDHKHSRMSRTRLRKRHSHDLFVHHHQHASDNDLEWHNPCGGTYEKQPELFDEQGNSLSLLRRNARRNMQPLERLVMAEHIIMRESHPQAIKTDDIKMWHHYKKVYAFLPNVKRNSSIALRLWYGHMQTYVATFTHLARAQYKYDVTKSNTASETSQELDNLLLSARRMLCEIETTFNASRANERQRKLPSVSRIVMNARVNKLLTNGRELQEAKPLDLKFAKYTYLKYLATIRNILRKHKKRRSHGQDEDSSIMSNENSSRSLSTLEILNSSGASDSNEVVIVKNTNNRPKIHRAVRRRQRPGQQSKSAELPAGNEV